MQKLQSVCSILHSFGSSRFSLPLCGKGSPVLCQIGSLCSPAKVSEKIGFIGDGNMAKAIYNSISKHGIVEPNQVHVSSPYTKNLDIWRAWNVNVTTDNLNVVQAADIVFLAVKPQLLEDVINQLLPNKDKITNKLFVSILAGIPLKKLESLLSEFIGLRVIRVMPNTPMLVGEGCTMYCPGSKATEDDIELIKTILEVTGICAKLPEYMINAFGSVAASGPAYVCIAVEGFRTKPVLKRFYHQVYLMIEALSDGGVKMGLPRLEANRFAAQTVLGAAKMVLTSGKHPGQLKDDVCSTGGTTICGMHELENCGVRGAIMKAVEAATNRAVVLSKICKE